MRIFTLTWTVFACFVLGLRAQAPDPATPLFNTNKTDLKLSLDDCVRQALVQNLAIQINRSSPEVARYALSGSYGYYDPSFTGRAGESYVENPGGYNDTINTSIPGSKTYRNDFLAAFNGVLPTGTRYVLESTLNENYGQSFFLTNPITGAGVFRDIPLQYSSTIRVGVTQPLLRDFWIDAGRLNIKLAKKDLRQSELGFEFGVMQIVRDVAVAYYDLIAARDQIRVQQQAVDLAEQFAREQKRRVEVGTAAPLDEKQAESQAATARSDLIRARFNAEAAENIFKRLISGNFVGLDNTRIDPSEKLLAIYQSINMTESRFNGLTLRPDYNQTKIDIEKADIRLQYDRNQLFPSLNVDLTYGRNGVANTPGNSFEQIGNNEFERYGAAVILNFPLTFRSERNNFKITKVSKQTALLTLKNLEEQIVAGIDTSVKAIQSAYAATSSTREARIYAEAALEAQQKKFENGKSTAFEVLEMQKNLTDASSQEINALAAYNKALHQLYFQEGTTLRRAKIQLDFK